MDEILYLCVRYSQLRFAELNLNNTNNDKSEKIARQGYVIEEKLFNKQKKKVEKLIKGNN